MTHLAVTQLRKGVDDDTEDDVEADGGDDDEEGEVKDGLAQVEVERLVIRDLQELSYAKLSFHVHLQRHYFFQ